MNELTNLLYGTFDLNTQVKILLDFTFHNRNYNNINNN